MFAAVGRFSVRFAVPVIAFWVTAAVLSVLLLPSLSSVDQTQQTEFLPVSAPSIQAAGLAAPFQPPDVTTSVVVAADDRGPLTSPDLVAIGRLAARVRALPAVKAVLDLGMSSDRAADELSVQASAGIFGEGGAAIALVDAVRRTFTATAAPAALHFHLTGDLATSADLSPPTDPREQRTVAVASILFILVLVLLVFRALLAPVVALAPPGLALVLCGPVVAWISRRGFPVSDFTTFMFVIVVLGLGTDYGLFLIARVRERLADGGEPADVVVDAVASVGRAITFSAATVAVAFAVLLLAGLDLYRGLGLDLVLATVFVLAVDLTMLPALLALFGRAVFWPSVPRPGTPGGTGWGRIAARATARPVHTLVAGTALLGALALVATGYSGGLGIPSLATTSDSAVGMAVVAAHFPPAEADPTAVLFEFPLSVWDYPYALSQAERGLRRVPQFSAVAGALDPNGTPLAPAELVHLHRELGRADRLSVIPPTGTRVDGREYEAYRATSQFVSPDGRTVQFDASLAAGRSASDRAIATIPGARSAVEVVGRDTGAIVTAVGGVAAQSSDLVQISGHDLVTLVPVVLVCIALIMVLLLGGVLAPLYLTATVGLSYLAALGLTVLIFRVVGGDAVLNFTLPFLMFVFLMAIGQDYNILVITRIREEARHRPLDEAVREAMARTGTTVSSAGVILAGTFIVLGAATTGAPRQLGTGVALGILLDTFVVRTLLVPSIVVLVDRMRRR
jgi:RND superfamily putative drug exporter